MVPPAANEPDPPDGPTVVHRLAWDQHSAMAFRELHDEEPLLLLTPAGTVRASREHGGMDPFQILGEALAMLHRRVCHVPCIYWAGMTDLIYGWLDKVPTVVVVVCEPAGRSQEDVQRMLFSQQQFVEATLAAYNKINEGTEPSAISVIYFGKKRFVPPAGIPLCLGFPPYERTKVSTVARELLMQCG